MWAGNRNPGLSFRQNMSLMLSFANLLRKWYKSVKKCLTNLFPTVGWSNNFSAKRKEGTKKFFLCFYLVSSTTWENFRKNLNLNMSFGLRLSGRNAAWVREEVNLNLLLDTFCFKITYFSRIFTKNVNLYKY